MAQWLEHRSCKPGVGSSNLPGGIPFGVVASHPVVEPVLSRAPCRHGIRYGLVVRISGFHPGGPGSIPGIGKILFHFASSGPQSGRK